MTRYLALLALAACLACAEQVLFDASAKDALAHVAASDAPHANQVAFAMAQEHGAPVLRVDGQASESYPGVAIKPAKPWDLSAAAWVEATIANPSDHSVPVVLRVDNPGDWKSNPWNGEVVWLPARQSAKLRVWFGRSWGKPGFKLDPKQVNEILLFLSQPKEAGSFTIRKIVAGGKPGDQP